MNADKMLQVILDKLEGVDPYLQLKLLHTKQAAEILNVKPQTMSLWRHKGIGPNFVKCGASVRYSPSSIADFISQNTISVS